MTMLPFVAEWAIRSSILIVSGALLVAALRVKDASIRLAAWTTILAGSIAIAAWIIALPKAPAAVTRVAPISVSFPLTVALPAASAALPSSRHFAAAFDWSGAATAAYALVAIGLLLRLGFGMAITWRLMRTSRVTEGGFRESERVSSPVTLGLARPVIVLPRDWREWPAVKLEAVLEHERAHARRFDPAMQLVSATHRGLLWINPLSWFLHSQIVRAAEEASDNAAVAATGDRAAYAEILLEFMQRGVRRAGWIGVPMARYRKPGDRIRRILNGTSISRGVTRRTAAAILALAAPVIYVAASARAAGPREAQPQAVGEVVETPAAPAQAAPAAAQPTPTASARSVQGKAAYIEGLGNATPLTSVVIKSRIDGRLKSIEFKEGQPVKAGQLLATVDNTYYAGQALAARRAVQADMASLENARTELTRLQKLVDQNVIPPEQLTGAKSAVLEREAQLSGDEDKLQDVTLQLRYGDIVSPIDGVAGLLQINPGNMVHPTDTTGIVTIVQVQPIAVVFSIAEDALPPVLQRLREGASLSVEAWSRDKRIKIATGHLIAVDNQIDIQTGMAKLKAEFDNDNGVLFPNQFVNVRLYVK